MLQGQARVQLFCDGVKKRHTEETVELNSTEVNGGYVDSPEPEQLHIRLQINSPDAYPDLIISLTASDSITGACEGLPAGLSSCLVSPSVATDCAAKDWYGNSNY